MLDAAEAQPEQAIRLAGAARALRATLQHPIAPADGKVLEQWLEPARRELGEPLAATAWRAGEAMSTEHAIMCVRVLEQ